MNSRFDEKKKTGHPTPLPNHAAYRTVPHVSSIKAPPPPFVKKKLHQADTELIKKPKPKLVQFGPPISRYFPIVRRIFSFFFLLHPLLISFFLSPFKNKKTSLNSKRRLQQLAQTSSSTFTASQTPITSSASGLSIQHLRDTVRRIERNIESEFIENADGPSLDIYNNSTPLQQVVIKAQLKDSQLRMALWLNQLPFKKYLTWWPEITNAHATAIVRCVNK